MEFEKRNCPICERPEKPNETYHSHYGGDICCISCKAFFRRFHRERMKKPKCKFRNQCQVNYQTRRNKCTACRYAKCLSIGMKKELVVVDEHTLKKFVFIAVIVLNT